ncbi:unnamed protein product, partial [Ectocarpus sp. 12 AP-2014]
SLFAPEIITIHRTYRAPPCAPDPTSRTGSVHEIQDDFPLLALACAMPGIQARLFGDEPTWIRTCADIPTEAAVAGTRPSPSYRPHRLCSNPQDDRHHGQHGRQVSRVIGHDGPYPVGA